MFFLTNILIYFIKCKYLYKKTNIMAKQTQTSSVRRVKPKVKRRGVGAKAGTSKNKHSKNYKKKYNGQG